MSTITFVLSGPTSKPIGGNKIIFEYANRFVEDGHRVHIIVPSMHMLEEHSLLSQLGMVLRYPLVKLYEPGYTPYSWFPLDRRVELSWVPSLSERYIPDGDVVLATACETAEPVNGYSPRKGRKFYFIQHFEDWNFSAERVRATWTLPLHKIVITRWLQQIAHDLGEPCDLVYNGLDFDDFDIDTPLLERDPKHIIMLYHSIGWKGSAIGLRAVELVRARDKNVKFTLFGATTRPLQLPRFIEFHRAPKQSVLRALYNRAAIGLGTSFSEGFGLTVAEAMQCGCAVACTDIPGYEMAQCDVTALTSAPGDPQSLARNIERLMTDEELRLRLARAGHELVKAYTWDRAYQSFRRVLFESRESH